MRTYAITGTSSGIGKATRDLLEAQGHRVIGIGRRNAEIEIDLGDPGQRESLGQRVADAVDGKLDAVIAVSGTTEMSPAGLQVNFYGARDTLLALRPLLAASASPRAVVVSSISAVHPNHVELSKLLLHGDEGEAMRVGQRLVDEGNFGALYTSAKRAISEWVRESAVTDDWAGAGIALNCVAPGTIVTPMVAHHLETEEGRAMLARSTPMPLNGPAQPEVVANFLAWLSSDANSHITGQAIFLDGGAEAVLRGPHVFGGIESRMREKTATD